MKTLLAAMTGLGFSLGVLLGLLLQLPADTSLPADPLHPEHNAHFQFRSRRSLNGVDSPLNNNQQNNNLLKTNAKQHSHILPEAPPSQTLDSPLDFRESSALTNSLDLIGGNGAARQNTDQRAGTDPGSLADPGAGDNPVIGSLGSERRQNNEQIHVPRDGVQDSRDPDRDSAGLRPDGDGRGIAGSRDTGVVGGNRGNDHHQNGGLRLTINSRSDGKQKRNNNSSSRSSSDDGGSLSKTPSPEDLSYLSTLVKGAVWNPEFELSCPGSFSQNDVGRWRNKAESMDVVKMEAGCGRMQNRLLTLRDSSKACARYRLNTDQIQGEIFSYYLARLLNISNIPPTLLVRVNALVPKWRTVHLDISLAQWAEDKLVVLTQFVPELSPAHIPGVFRDERNKLNPVISHLGSKTHPELCELVQWSDLIVLDYLTANLDRVINNMFNRQWNDQMMHNPAHNLEKFKDGRLVFLDNESGLFHGYRLLDKYARYHETLLKSLCVFRESTAKAVKRLHASRSVGSELHTLFNENEALHEHLAGIPEKNVKILQRRLGDVYEQIVRCENDFNR